MRMTRMYAELLKLRGDQSQTAFAKELGISKQQWSDIQCGRRRLGRSVIEKAIKRWPHLANYYFADVVVSGNNGNDAKRDGQ